MGYPTGSAREQGSPAPPPSSDQNISPTKTPTRMTQLDLDARDRNAVAYSKAQLSDGDTLVLIKYPTNCEVFDITGFKMAGGDPFRVHSEKLLATGSKVFKKLFSDWDQTKFRRRNGYVHGLPAGIKYILNLTPPDEGDEAVNLTTDLYCSPGIRSWYSAEQRCNVSGDLVGGKDEVIQITKPRPAQKYHNSLIDALTDETFESQIRTDSRVHWNTIGEVDNTSTHDTLASTLREREDPELEEAIQLSKAEVVNHTSEPNIRSYTSIDEIPAYCPIRHRVGIEKLLQLIEGKDPRFDSAPKIWTLFALAKYFDCTKVVVDTIVSWVLAEPNCRFIEILPEATLKIGLGLEAPMLARPAFAILVSECALTIASRECGGARADQANTNQFGRVREDIGEDDLDAIQAAGYEFANRIESSYKNLLAPEMGWLSSLTERQKLAGFMEWVRSSKVIDEYEKDSITDTIAGLDIELSNHVRGIIIWSLNGQLLPKANVDANLHRRAETYLKEYDANFAETTYMRMAEKEKLLTVFPWMNLRNQVFSSSTGSNKLCDVVGVSNWHRAANKKLAAVHGVEPVWCYNIQETVGAVNRLILSTMKNHGFKDGVIPEECFRARYPWNSFVDGATLAQQKPSRTQEGRAFRAFEELLHSQDDELKIPDSASTTGVYNLPMRPKPMHPRDPEDLPLSPKRSHPNDPTSSETLGHVRKRSTSSGKLVHTGQFIEDPFLAGDATTGLTGTSYLANDPRTAAIASHNSYGASFSRPGLNPTVPNFVPNVHCSEKPLVPDSINIESDSPFFSLRRFCDQVESHVSGVANSLLSKGEELDFTVLTDTLLCLTENEWKFLPLWAGGSNDGSGGVFDGMVPPAPPGTGAAGPGPSFHTGFSLHSRASTEMDFDGSSTIGGSINTSIAVDNGLSDHVDRRRIIVESESDFHSETFSDDTEKYDGMVEDDAETSIGKGKGKAVNNDRTAPVAAHAIGHGPSAVTPDDVEPGPAVKADDEDIEWEAEDNEVPFDSGEDQEDWDE
ncbi:hypothetical protein D0Z07_0623 [Hyphodiscus hymeniophilus]|uniref:Uncharacterized protein n=1 Tax=Hyphodiscus hymeniophilus TaxID=353542 RepID=A0A9P6VQL8_9HELO|nr:hypothetical protein D0Z07_0623 [Hyphodiscus hymeniophilus]